MIGDEDDNDHPVIDEEPVNAEDLFGEDLGISSLANKDDNEAVVTEVGRKKRKTINRLPALNQAWLLNEKHEGVAQVNSYFQGIKFKAGRGHELTNLKLILKRYEYWAQQCYPKLCFQDFVEKVEDLSSKNGIRSILQQNRNKSRNMSISNTSSSLTDKISPRVESNPNLFGGDSPNKLKQNFIEMMPESSVVITENLRESIFRKREEAIAKRKLKLEQSVSQSIEENSIDFSITETQVNNTSTLFDKSTGINSESVHGKLIEEDNNCSS